MLNCNYLISLIIYFFLFNLFNRKICYNLIFLKKNISPNYNFFPFLQDHVDTHVIFALFFQALIKLSNERLIF